MSVYLDASVLTAIVLAEAHGDRARAFAVECGQPLQLSDLGLLEAVSAFGRLVRMERIGADEARDSLAKLQTWAAHATTETRLQPSDFAFAETALLQFDLGLRAPDALHIAIANRLGATLATLDRKQASGARAVGVAAIDLAA